MRLYLKKQCLDMLDTLDEAEAEIGRLLKGKDGNTVLSLLEQCQESAITIGNAIDSACAPAGNGDASGNEDGADGGAEAPAEENEGSSAVHALETYCELLYQLHEAIAAGTSVNEASMLKKLRAQVKKCRNELKNTVSTQREVVFLPYKASMWDSLEGFWKKADADPDVNAVVIPIPYYDKMPDGTFGAIHYEGDLYPKDVPVVNYEDYDFEAKHPDQIYIHNPYDGGNFVTSVHPFFYSANLKKFTDDLTYVPYFVLGEPANVDDPQALSHMAHFVQTYGVFNADHVIVQSENMRKAYITILVACSSEGEATRPYWEAKISGAGSSKLEKAEHLSKVDYVLPPEWEALIFRPDGTRKKTILYNTSVSTLLKENVAYITKIVDVLNVFKQNQNNVILWWRPHPLMMATLTSMRPELAPIFDALVNQYRAEGWGIYDDTPDLDRAIACTDAYYGDPSSLVELYQKTKKPIMIENCQVLERKAEE